MGSSFFGNFSKPNMLNNTIFQTKKSQDGSTLSPLGRGTSNQTTAGSNAAPAPPKKMTLKETLLGSGAPRVTQELNTSRVEDVYNGVGLPEFNMTRQDMLNLQHGRGASQAFLEQNRGEIQKFIDIVMKSEEKMQGYLEFSNKTMTVKDGEQAQQEDANSGRIRREQEMNEAKIQNDILKKEVQEMKEKYQFDANAISKGHKARLATLYGIEERPTKSKNLNSIGITTQVMEHWINDTLKEAEHLDIPGCIL